MGINPPSDIVSDVARAADPVRYAAAARRLSDLAQTADGSDFKSALKATEIEFSGPPTVDDYTIRVALKNDAVFSREARTDEVYQQFEALVLRNFVETMLPKNSEAVFGKGTAASIWRSMMAEQIGHQVAKAGGIGLASSVMAAHPSVLVKAEEERSETQEGISTLNAFL